MIIDKVIEYINKSKDLDKEKLIKDISNATLIKSQNIANYLLQDNEKEVFDFREDFPNVAPPWNTYILEWKFPEYTYSKEKGIIKADADFIKLEFFTLIRTEDSISNEFKDKLKQSLNIECKWFINLLNFVSINGKIYLPGISSIFIDKDGKIITHDGKGKEILYIASREELPNDATISLTTEARLIYLMATTFCHCKNVEKQSNYIDKNLFKNRKRNNLFPLNKYYILKINPHNTPNKSVEKGLWNNSLHICRGHFRKYTEEFPLFGKYYGTYWVPMHLKGNSKIGIIKKDYKI